MILLDHFIKVNLVKINYVKYKFNMILESIISNHLYVSRCFISIKTTF